jgi:hypothetical protein
VIEQSLPAAVVEHLRVLDVQPKRPVRVHALQLSDGRWVSFQTLPRLHPGIVEYMRARDVVRVELTIPDSGISEFEIEEMVW